MMGDKWMMVKAMTVVAIVIFPGSNREVDVARAMRRVGTASLRVVFVSSRDRDLPRETSHVILPGGFSYGDYLRGGALAKVSPIMSAVVRFANQGGRVLGICNGFQILTEVGLLEGGLVRNVLGRFICKEVNLSVEVGGRDGFFEGYEKGEEVTFPVAHGEGRFVADDDTLQRLESENRVVLRYREDINGSMKGIAGTCSPSGRVVGFMPHPENAVGCQSEGISEDGIRFFAGFIEGSAGF